MTTYSILKEDGRDVWRVMISAPGAAPVRGNLYATEAAAKRNAAALRAADGYREEAAASSEKDAPPGKVRRKR